MADARLLFDRRQRLSASASMQMLALNATCDLMRNAFVADYAAVFLLDGTAEPVSIGDPSTAELHGPAVMIAGSIVMDVFAATLPVVERSPLIRRSVVVPVKQDVFGIVSRRSGSSGAVAVVGRIDREFSGTDAALARRMANTFSLHMEQSVELDGRHHRGDRLAAAMDVTSDAVLVLDQDGAVTSLNKAARLLLDCGDGVRLFGKHITAVGLNDAVRLQSAINHHLLQTESALEDYQATTFSVQRKVGRPLTVAVMQPGTVDGRRVSGVIVRIVDPATDLHDQVASVCAMYSLTGAERRLAQALVTGISLTEAAAKLRIQLPTARSYLNQIFAKTETNRQAALVHLMMSSVNRLPSHIRSAVI